MDEKRIKELLENILYNKYGCKVKVELKGVKA